MRFVGQLMTVVLTVSMAAVADADAPKPRANEALHKSWCQGNACNILCERPPKGAAKVDCQKGNKGVVNLTRFQKFAAGVEATDLVDAEAPVATGGAGSAPVTTPNR